LDETLTVELLLSEAEAATTFGSYEEDDGKLARRQLNRVVIHLAKLWVDGDLGHPRDPSMFVENIKWVLDLMETGWPSRSPSFQLEVRGAEADLTSVIVDCSAKYGPSALAAMRDEFDQRWAQGQAARWPGLRRTTVITFVQAGIETNWATEQLKHIETTMLANHDLYERIEECENQAKAWLAMGNKDRALSVLGQLIKSSRGIPSENDNQLVEWARWLRAANALEPQLAKERLRIFLRQALSLEGHAEGISSTLAIVLQACFDLSPLSAIELHRRLLERNSLDYEESIISIVDASLDLPAPPLRLISQVINELVIPIVRGSSADTIRHLIERTYESQGQAQAIQVTRHSIHRIRTAGLPSRRGSWFKGIQTALNTVGIETRQVGLEADELIQLDRPDTNSLDYSLHLKSSERLSQQEADEQIRTIADLRRYLDLEDKAHDGYFKWHDIALRLIEQAETVEATQEICDLMNVRITGHSRESYLAQVYLAQGRRLNEMGLVRQAQEAFAKALALTQPSGWAVSFDGGVKYAVMREMLRISGHAARSTLVKLFTQDLVERFRSPGLILMDFENLGDILFGNVPYTHLWPDLEVYLNELFAGTTVLPQDQLEEVLDSYQGAPELDTAEGALAGFIGMYIDFPAQPVVDQAIRVAAEALLDDTPSIQGVLRKGLSAHDQMVDQCLQALAAATLHRPGAADTFGVELVALQQSPNYMIRSTATMILNIARGLTAKPPAQTQPLRPIYSIYLPDIAPHKTEEAIKRDENPVLLGDAALLLRPLDVELRVLAELADLPEPNILYRAGQLFKELEPHRTWLIDGMPLRPERLTRLLQSADLRFSHNLPKIAPARNAMAHVAAELYDAGRLTGPKLSALESILAHSDPQLYWLEPEPRPGSIQRIGSLDYDHEPYMEIPKDWLSTTESSLALLGKSLSGGLTIIAEWTRLKRLDRDWPIEERMSWLRMVSPTRFWEVADPEDDKPPFAQVRNAYVAGYRDISGFPLSELAIANNGYRFQNDCANWLAFNPKVGIEMQWRLSNEGWFRWINRHGEVMVESIWWQDGAFDLMSDYDHVEVGNGWMVVMTDKAYRLIRQRFPQVARGGVVRRSLGWLGTGGRANAFSLMDTP